MSGFLVISDRHGLLPLAQRLRGEGHEVDAVIWNPGQRRRYDRAWEGAFDKLVRRGDLRRTLETMIEAAREAGIAILTDSRRAIAYLSEIRLDGVEVFAAGPFEETPSSALRIGGWFDGESMQAPHLLFFDVGAWPGGLGPRVDAAAVLVRIDHEAALDLYDRLWRPMQDALKSSGFRGLVQGDLNVATASGEPRIESRRSGWAWLQWHAFLSEMPENEGEGLGAVLGGAVPVLPRKFVVALPLSVPPWPHTTAKPRDPQPIPSLSTAQRARVFWHDIRVEEAHLHTAGLDGMVGVVRGAADSFELARSRALDLAAEITLPERQLRTNVGAPLPAILATIEDLVGFTI